MTPLPTRLRNWTHAADAVPASDLMDEAADRIERLESLTRFQDRVIRSGDTATLTVEEREAVRFFSLIDGPHNVPIANKRAATLRGLLERMSRGEEQTT